MSDLWLHHVLRGLKDVDDGCSHARVDHRLPNVGAVVSFHAVVGERREGEGAGGGGRGRGRGQGAGGESLSCHCN